MGHEETFCSKEHLQIYVPNRNKVVYICDSYFHLAVVGSRDVSLAEIIFTGVISWADSQQNHCVNLLSLQQQVFS